MERLKNSKYSLHPAFAMEAKVVAGMKGKTGKSIEEWIELVQAQTGKDDAALAKWLKSEFRLGTNYAKFVVDRAAGRGGAENYRPEELVDAQYAGKKAGLLPIYDRLLKLSLDLGEDVHACPTKHCHRPSAA